MQIKSDTGCPVGEFEVLKDKVETKILETLLMAQQIYGRQFEAPYGCNKCGQRLVWKKLI